MTDKSEKVTEDPVDEIANAYAEYDRFSYIASKSIKFRGKSIDEWLVETAIPEISENISMDEFERVNYLTINLIEKINKNYAYAKSSFDLSNMKYQSAYNKEKIGIIEKCQVNKSKIPNVDLLDSIIINNIKDIFLAFRLSELFHEFWKSVHSKVKSLDGRLTSISMIHNSSRGAKYDS